MKRLSLILLSLVFLCYCDITPENYEPEPNIYAVLSTDSLHALVMVGKTAGLKDTIRVDTIVDTFWHEDSTFDTWVHYAYRWNGVSGLEVSLKKTSQTLSLEENADSIGYYRIQPVSFKPGETWGLEVNYPDGSNISASTTFPGEFEITSPESNMVSYYDTLAWSKPQGACGYSICILQWITYWDEDTFYVDSIAQRIPFLLLPYDSCSISLDRLLYFGGPGYPDSVAFLVSALDTNAYDYIFATGYYYFPSSDSLILDDYMHIDGAWGVFGSQTVARSRTYQIYIK